MKTKMDRFFEGMITKETDHEIILNVDGLDLMLPKSEVKSVKRGPVSKKQVESTKNVTAKPSQASKDETSTQSAIPLDKLERPVIVFDQRSWKLGYQNAANNQVIAEFVVDGQTVQNWTELVTAQLFLGLRSEPRYYVQYVKEKTAAACPDAQWNTIQESPYDVMYEWSVRNCSKAPDQSEIARVILGADGLHVLHYAIKAKEMSAENRQKWIECLKASQIVKPQAS